MIYRTLKLTDYKAYDSLRSTALDAAPAMFLATNEEELPAREERFREMCAHESHFIMGAFDGETLIGMAGFHTAGKKKQLHAGWLWGMFVMSEYRGKGIGTQLLDSFLKRVRSLPHISKIVLGVNAVNKPAIALYRSAGFVVYGTEPKTLIVDGIYYDELLMVLMLDL